MPGGGGSATVTFVGGDASATGCKVDGGRVAGGEGVVVFPLDSEMRHGLPLSDGSTGLWWLTSSGSLTGFRLRNIVADGPAAVERSEEERGGDRNTYSPRF